MAIFERMLNAMRLNSDDDDEYYNDEYLDEEEEETDYDDRPARRRGLRSRKKAEKEEEISGDVYKQIPEKETSSAKDTQNSSKSSKITPMRQSKKSQGGNTPMEVCVIKPTSVEDAREITETLLNNRTVVLNLEGLDLDVAQRIIDFTSGSCFAINGNLQKVSTYIFIVTPSTVDISGDFQNILDAFDSSSIQTDI